MSCGYNFAQHSLPVALCQFSSVTFHEFFPFFFHSCIFSFTGIRMNGLGEGTWGAMSRKRNVQKSFRLAIYSVVILIVVYRACQMRTSVCKKKKKQKKYKKITKASRLPTFRCPALWALEFSRFS